MFLSILCLLFESVWGQTTKQETVLMFTYITFWSWDRKYKTYYNSEFWSKFIFSPLQNHIHASAKNWEQILPSRGQILDRWVSSYKCYWTKPWQKVSSCVATEDITVWSEPLLFRWCIYSLGYSQGREWMLLWDWADEWAELSSLEELSSWCGSVLTYGQKPQQGSFRPNMLLGNQ